MSNETTTAGRPPIDASRYYAQIEAWLTEGKRIDEITATMLQRTVGGQYKKISETLERYKTGYISKELMELPPVPDELGNAVNAAALEIWRILQGEKSKEIAELKEQQADDLAGLEQLAAERLDRVDELEQQIEVKDQETNNLKQQLTNLVEVNSRLDSELKQVTHQSQELMLELRQLRGELSVAQQTTIKQQANIEHLQEQLSKAEVQAKALAADNRQYQKTAELAQAKSDRQKSENAQLVLTTKEQAEELRQLRAEQSTNHTEIAKQRGVIEQLQLQLTKAEQRENVLLGKLPQNTVSQVDATPERPLKGTHYTIDNMLSTSADDAKVTLMNLAERYPTEAKDMAEKLIHTIESNKLENKSTLLKAAKTALNKANKKLAQ